MKKKTIINSLAGLCCYFIISGFLTGPATHGWDCTGAELNMPTGCTAHDCHSTSATTDIAVAIELDSAGMPTTHYKGGLTYTVQIKGVNNTTSSLPKFGFQMGCIVGSSALATPISAGTWSTNTPANTHYTAPQANVFSMGIIEHSTSLSPATGTGGQGTIYAESFTWTAPAAGTGTISFWAALNAVNDNGTHDVGDLWNTNHAVIDEWTSTTGVAEASLNMFNVNVFPNPLSEYVTFTYTLEQSSDVLIKLIDIQGKTVANLLHENQAAGSQSNTVRLDGINEGVYFLETNINNRQVVRKILVK